VYNCCLIFGVFPKRKKLIPILKLRKESSDEVLKYRPISLLNVGGKVLEKVINRINHHVYTNGYINNNQYEFTPQVSTIYAVMAVKEFVEEGFRIGKVTAIVSLDVEGAFNSSWWPSILKSLKESGCPQNLYNITKSFFSQRTASLLTNIRLEREVSKGFPHGSCCCPGLWIIQYNSLLNLKYTKRTKAIAYADNLILIARGKTVREAENIAKLELGKISTWAKKKNKIQFNEQKSKVILMTRRKRK